MRLSEINNEVGKRIGFERVDEVEREARGVRAKDVAVARRSGACMAPQGHKCILNLAMGGFSV